MSIQIAQPVGLPFCELNWAASAGMYSRLLAKITGITPAWLTFSGMYVEDPPNCLRPTIRRAYCTGIRRCACSMKMTAAITTRPTRTTSENTSYPWVCLIPHSAAGNVEITEVKMRIDIPLPMPRSVMSSPSHMMTAVPAVIVMTMMSRVVILSLTSSEPLQLPWKIAPVLASATMPVDCRMASPRVR